MPILLDGNNLLHRLPKANRTRADLRRLVLEATRNERASVIVVFDGPPPAAAAPEEFLGKVTVVYAAPKSADDVIISRLPIGPAARNWVVVTDDRGLARRARDRGAELRRLDEWHSRRSVRPQRPPLESKLSSREVEDWERYFDARAETGEGNS
jgi:hypothetical protein